MNILLVGDPHSSPDTDNRRFDWLGRMILEVAPDMVVCMGDFTDLNSLSSYDRGKKTGEGRRYALDIAAAIDANTRVFSPMRDFNAHRRNIRKAQFREPRFIMLYGNHEDRINRAINSSPELAGKISLEDLEYAKFGWDCVPYRTPVQIEGIWFNHFFPSGVKGEAISGFTLANSLLAKNFASSIVGHSHLFDHAIRSKPDGQAIIGLSCGWYGEQATYEDATQAYWWAGVNLLRDVHDGVYDLEQFSMERIKRLYA